MFILRQKLYLLFGNKDCVLILRDQSRISVLLPHDYTGWSFKFQTQEILDSWKKAAYTYINGYVFL